MDEAFIIRARKILLDNLEDDGFGVAQLSREAGLSKSQLLRKIKGSTGKTASEFIRETRLQEAAVMLKDRHFTSSEIAYRVGFGSPSYFNKCFHEHYGMTPGEFKLRKKDEKPPEDPIPINSKKNYGKVVLITFIIFIFFTALFLHFNFFSGEHLIADKKEYAIAVLPFLDLANNDGSDYLADGITEAITLELARSNEMRVISRGSAMSFKDTKKHYKEIATALNVNLLLEGSVLFDKDSLRVVAQLIEPFPEERHLWAGNFNLKIENIIGLVESVSRSIAHEINLAVLPEGPKLQNYPINPEAYDLYLRGRHLWNHATPESLTSAIEYLKGSIKIDSNFAAAYATLAESYILMNKFSQDENEKKDNIKLGKISIDKALEKGPYLAEAYITKGNILGKFDWNWEGMRKMTEKGLELDPNNSYAHTQMSKYYLFRNNMEKSIEEALIAEKIDPMNARAGRIVAERYFHDHKYDLSQKQFEKVLELHPDDPFAYNGLGVLNWVTGKKEDARKNFLKFQQLMKNHTMAEKLRNGGIDDSMYFFLERAKTKAPQYCSNPSQIAMVSQFMGQEEEALIFLEAAYVQHDVDLPMMLYGPMFEPLYDEPRFLDVAARTGVHIPIAIKP
jgi:TolB-like protein/AraC-like DNA-binding protein/Tfp pilus assembly protein PilF